LFDPYGDLADRPNVRRRHGWQREESRRRCTLELASAHFAAQLPISPAAGDARAHMGSGQFRIALCCYAARVGRNCPGSKLAHPSCCRDCGYTIELDVRASRCGTYLSQWEPKQASG